MRCLIVPLIVLSLPLFVIYAYRRNTNSLRLGLMLLGGALFLLAFDALL